MIDRTLSHYKVVDKIGEGGMSAVYKAEDTRLVVECCLGKKFQGNWALNAEPAQRFFQEARAAAGLKLRGADLMTTSSVIDRQPQPEKLQAEWKSHQRWR